MPPDMPTTVISSYYSVGKAAKEAEARGRASFGFEHGKIKSALLSLRERR